MPHRTITGNDDDALVATVVAAVKAFEAADAVKKEKALKLGELLAEAQKRHPTDRAFEAFLTRAGGIQIRRAKDLISIALGRKEFDKHQSDNAAAHGGSAIDERPRKSSAKRPRPLCRRLSLNPIPSQKRTRSPMHYVMHHPSQGRSRTQHQLAQAETTSINSCPPAEPFCHA